MQKQYYNLIEVKNVITMHKCDNCKSNLYTLKPIKI